MSTSASNKISPSPIPSTQPTGCAEKASAALKKISALSGLISVGTAARAFATEETGFAAAALISGSLALVSCAASAAVAACCVKNSSAEDLENPKTPTPTKQVNVTQATPQVKKASSSAEPTTLYFDLGSWQSWNFVDWSTTPATLNQAGLDTWLGGLAQQMQAGKVTQIGASFAQLNDLGNILSGNLTACSTDDSFYMLAVNSDSLTITVDGKQLNILQYMVNFLQSQGISTTLSFGGSVAQEQNLEFLAGTTPAAAAAQVVQVAQMYGFTRVDFDLETGSEHIVPDNGAANLATFFATLNAQIPITLTVMGDVAEWGPAGQFFGPIFQQGYAFNQMFSGINLMLFSDTQYYIDATGSQYSWDLVTWLENCSQTTGGALTPAECAPFISIGFNSSINYLLPGSSAGETYQFPASVTTSGAAAESILTQVQANVAAALDVSSVTFGSPFFWPGDGNYGVASPGDVCQFLTADPFEADFAAAAETV